MVSKNMRSAPQMLECAAEVTRERDTEKLRRSLLQTLQEVLAMRWATITDLSAEDGDDLGPPCPEPLVVEWIRRPDTSPAVYEGISSKDARALLRSGQSLQQPVSDGQGLLYLRSLGEDLVFVARLGQAGAEDIRLVESFCRLYENFGTVIRESERDRLTGLLNRRSFDDKVGRLAIQGLVPGPALEPRVPTNVPRGPLRWWLALFDVDHFKKVNDTFGHLYGDEVLLLLARITQQSFRGEDRCFRYGGEEFAVLLARNDCDGARTALERLRLRVEQNSFPQVGQVTISIGYAALEPGMAPADAIDHADRALYSAKRGGRNRTVAFARNKDDPTALAVPASGAIELF